MQAYRSNHPVLAATKRSARTTRWLTVAALCSGFLIGCSSGDDDSSSGALVSCDIVQAGLHYCEEAPGSGTNTGCPANMAGFTPGTGCPKEGVAASCKSGPYTFYIYDNATAASELASLCPQGSGAGGSGAGGSGAGGSTGGTSSDGAKVTCYIPRYQTLQQGVCNGAYYTAAQCADQNGMVVPTCPENAELNGCCMWAEADYARLGTLQCFYNYPDQGSPTTACSTYNGTWSATP